MKKIVTFAIALLVIGRLIYAQDTTVNSPSADSLEFPLRTGDLIWSGSEKDPASDKDELLIGFDIILDDSSSNYHDSIVLLNNITVELRKDDKNFTSALFLRKLNPEQDSRKANCERVVILVPVAEDVALWQEALQMQKKWFDESKKYSNSLTTPRRIIPEAVSRKQYAFERIIDWGNGLANIVLHLDGHAIYIQIPLAKIKVVMRDDGVPATTVTFTPKSASEASEATILAGSEGELISFSQTIDSYNRQWLNQQKKVDRQDHRQK